MSNPTIELMQLRPPGAPPFVLALDAQHDRRIAPVMRETGVWELPETLLVLRTLRPGMHVVDAGAHVGYYSVLFSRCVGPTGAVRAFEPEPDNYRLLSANLLLNNCRNVHASPLALAGKPGRAALYLSPDNLGDHRLTFVPGRRHAEVHTIDLDSALGGVRTDFIKIDTQGAEPLILAGMDQTLRGNREHLACLMEFAPGLLALGGVTVEEFAAQLDTLGARAWAITLQQRNVMLRRLEQLPQGLAALAEELRGKGEIDASMDIFLVFGAAAEHDWLARYRG